MKVAAGGWIGDCALVTVIPKLRLALRFLTFLLTIIFKCVGFVMFKKYCGLRHQNWFSLPVSVTRLPPHVYTVHLLSNFCSMVSGSWTKSIDSEANTLKKKGRSASDFFSTSVLGTMI